MTAVGLNRESMIQPDAEELRLNSPLSNTTSWSDISQQQQQAFQPQEGLKRRQSEVTGEQPDLERGVRRRISRACDQCNQLKRKCDGQYPCACCSNSFLSCSYTRAHKKRGRVSKKNNTQQNEEEQRLLGQGNAGGHEPVQDASTNANIYQTSRESDLSGGPPVNAIMRNVHHRSSDATLNMATNSTSSIQGPMADVVIQDQFMIQDQTNFLPNEMPHDFNSPLDDIYSVAFMGKAPVMESPGWMTLTPSMFASDMPLLNAPNPSQTLLRFPVLQPLVPHLQSVMPANLACDLLEQYFASSTSAYLRPSNPYVLGYIFRKSSILHPTNPRPCSPALLASLLWVVAQTSDAPFLTAQLDTRANVCQRLLKLIIAMLGPLAHTFAPAGSSSDSHGDIQELIGFGRNTNGALPWKNQIDSLVTYIHLATVVSASERKASSLRWWNAAWLLARDLRLGREIPYDDDPGEGATHGSVEEERSRNLSMSNPDMSAQQDGSSGRSGAITEEDREERRRTWWLLYMMDRHLALCYNRPMFFANRECEKLLQPLDDSAWQDGRFIHASQRTLGLNTICVSHSVFGQFLPLMVILGEIVDLNHARNKPRLGPRAGHPRNFDDVVEEIAEQLELYGKSLDEFEAKEIFGPDTTQNVGSAFATQSSERALQTRTVTAYGRHIMHVLHILVAGRWDPLALLEDNDLWISSMSFVTATEHAVAAARAVSEIIDYDPDLSFMPFFFGIYLLQGSFLLLLFADKLGEAIESEVVHACETLVRAHEACVATLDTQYQVSQRLYIYSFANRCSVISGRS